MGKRRQKKQSKGAPAWMATFADMATLLMSFFVLLLAFSEMDVVKYKAISGSMKKALGVKADSTEITLPEGTPADIPELRGEEPPRPESQDGTGKEKGEHLSEEELLIREKLSEELKSEKIQLEVVPKHVIIRLPDHGTFRSGSADLADDFKPTLWRIRDVLSMTYGSVVVAGHTDDGPIHTARFRSNWDLSAARAASVVHELLDDRSIVQSRIVAHGYSDTRPLEPNTDNVSRAKNRRVEIILATKGGKRGRKRAEQGPPRDGGEEDGALPQEQVAPDSRGAEEMEEGGKLLEQPAPTPPEPEFEPLPPEDDPAAPTGDGAADPNAGDDAPAE